MLNLIGATDSLYVITSAAGDIEVHASYADLVLSSGVVTPGRTNTASIATATTTTVVAAPSSGTVRNVKYASIYNHSATISNTCEVYHTDGTNPCEMAMAILLPGERLIYGDAEGWKHYDSNNAEYTYGSTFDPGSVYQPSGYLAESIPRTIAGVAQAAFTSGTMAMQAIYLRAGTTVTNISYFNTTASATQTNRWVALYDSTRNLLGQSATAGATATTANSIVTQALTTPYKITQSGLYYAGILVAATTMNVAVGVTAAGNAAFRGIAPILTGTSTTALTTTAPNPAAAITATTASYWVAVS